LASAALQLERHEGMMNESHASTGATAPSSSGLEAFWHIFGLMVLFMMHIGFTILEVGSVSIKNTQKKTRRTS
jgi:hypothetical protein